MTLAEAPDANLTSKAFLQRVRLAASSCVQAVKALKTADFIYQQQDKSWAVLDQRFETWGRLGDMSVFAVAGRCPESDGWIGESDPKSINRYCVPLIA